VFRHIQGGPRKARSFLVCLGLSIGLSLYGGSTRADDGVDPVASFTSEIERAVAEARDGGPPIERVSELLVAFLRSGALPERLRRPVPGLPVTTYLLHAADDGSVSIAALVLRPGARAPLHDHRTWTVWGTAVGRDRERQYRRSDVAGGGFPDLEPLSDRRIGPGEVSVVGLPPRDVHVVENAGSEISVSVHVHGADLSRVERNRYDPERRTVVPFVQTYEGGGAHD
jgi:3-mercaptopropionate dioxygenase